MRPNHNFNNMAVDAVTSELRSLEYPALTGIYREFSLISQDWRDPSRIYPQGSKSCIDIP